jgi:PAS domain S-box-containing protein
MNIPTFTLLIVEDSATDRELYRRALSQDASCIYHLLEAESVVEGLTLCCTKSIDVILLDYLLPDGDGLKFLAELSVQSHGRMPPAVMMTGQGNEKIAVSALKLGAEDYLVKNDLTPELLQLKVRRAIENSRLRQQQQQQTERLRASVENMSDNYGNLSAIRDTRGEIIDFRFDYLNAAALESNQMTAADMSRSLCEVFPVVREALFEKYCQVIATGVPILVEDLIYTDVFGTQQLTKVYDIRINKLDDGVMLIWRDITAQKQLELNLTAANQQITTIWESMTDAYTMLDRDWRVVYTNSAATEIFRQTSGLTPADYLGKSHWEVFPTSVGTIVEHQYRRAVTDRAAVNFELFYEPTKTWFEIHAYPSEVGLGVYFRDISKRKWLECERIAAEQERDRFFNMSLDLLVIANFDQYFLRVNPACERTLGFTPAELMAESYLNFVHPDDREHTAAVAQGLSKGEVCLSFENRFRCKDGSYRWVLWNAISDIDRNLIYANGHDITDRKQAEAIFQMQEAAIQQQLGEIESIYRMAPVGLCFIDTDFRYVRINEELAQINGLSVAEHVGKTFQEVLPEVADLIEPTYRQVMKSGEPIINLEVTGTNRTQPGVERCWLASFYPQTDDRGRVIGVNNVVQEITDRKQAEIALKISEELSRYTFEYTSIGMAHVALDGTWIRVNRKICNILGYSSAELLATTFQAVTEPADLAEDVALVQQLINGEIAEYTLEKRYIHKQGHYVWANLTVSLIRTIAPDGQLGIPQYFISAIQDITDRKIAAQRLQESEQRLRTGVEVAGVGLARFDYATNLVELSPEAAALYGFAPDTSMITREQIHATFHPDERAELEAVIAQVIDPQGTGWFSQDHRVLWPNGEVRCLSVRKRVYFDRSGAVVHPSYAILAAIDVTDRKQTQADLEERNRELDSFVYVVSHDLKAPLRAVSNLSQWIEEDLEGQLTADTRSQMDLLRSRVDRMSATIEELLDYARCSRSDDAIEPISVAELLADVIDSVAPPATFTIDLPDQMPTLFIRRTPLFQVFLNLINNAIKHHHSETGTIQISILDRGNCYEFAVSDDGPGIAPEHHDRIFKIFQAVNPQKRSDSTGIGLAIVKALIESQGGRIWLDKDIQQGTRFCFTWVKIIGT